MSMFKELTQATGEPLNPHDLRVGPTIVTFALDGTILRFSASFPRLFGYEAGELVGRHHSMLVPDDEVEPDRFWSALQRGESRTIECRRIRKDGSPIRIQASYTPVVDADGRPLEIVLVTDLGRGASTVSDDREQIVAINKAQPVVHFAPDGTITEANDLFLKAMGYRVDDVLGRHHRMFVDPVHAASAEYAEFWNDLVKGRCRSSDHRCLGKGDRGVWLQATYSPICGPDGAPFKVVCVATDVTGQKSRQMDLEGQVAAIHKSRGVVAFDLDGTITAANDLFLRSVGYSSDEVVGRHHRMFVEPACVASQGYAAFWANLAKGRCQTMDGNYCGKDGREVWFQATYHPIQDIDGNTFKVVEFATDVTQEKLRQADHEGQIAAINKSQGVITFDMNGTVIDANDRFLEATGYRIDEIEGQHHRLFVEPAHVHGPEYAAFWDALSEGHHQAGEYKRYGKNDREVWLQATYNPIFDLKGRPFKVVKYATVVTREKLRQADIQGQIASIHKAQCVVSLAMDGTILDANHNFLAKTGYRLASVRGRHHRMFVEKAVADSQDYADFWSKLAKGLHQAAEYKCLCKDGQEIWLQATYTPIFDMSGRPLKVVKYATDVTQERLRQADYEGQIAAIEKSQCVATFNMDGIIIDANENFLRAMGYRLEEVKGRHHEMFLEPSLIDSTHYAEFWDTLRAGSFLSAKFRRVGKGGREVWIQASYNPILDLNGRPFKVIKIATDVTADVALVADLRSAKKQAEHDSTTGLPNRLRLADFMSRELAKPDARLVVFYLDLDHFKPINDSFGHHVGDHVLSVTANRLRRTLRHDQLVARFGGDEFIVAAPNLTDKEAETLCQRLITVVTAPIRHDRGTITIGLSIGVAISPGDARTSDELLKCADVALYRTKGNGRGSYTFFESGAKEDVAGNRHLADDMLRGIKAGQFFLEYQPRFNAHTRQLQGVEALVRWAHPQRGRIEPLEFIPLAEKSGLIVPLGAWVLRTACQTVKTWPGIGVSVNVSAVQFRSSDLIGTVSNVLAETGLEAHRLELELAEGVLVEDEPRARVTLDALKERGVRLAMAAFGTAESSMINLRRFPFDVLKIDQRLFADMEGQDEGRRLVQSMVKLSRMLGRSVSAEGIEPEEQLLLLRLDDGVEVQGFLLAHPMSAEAIAMLLLELEAEPLRIAG